MDRPQKVACIGLGKMGAGIARNVIKAGFETAVWNRSAEKAASFVDAGARLAASPRQAAENADIVVSCLFDDASVLDATQGPDGVLAGLPAHGIHCGTTTVSPGCTRQLVSAHSTHGSDYVASHVLGRPDAANEGQLLVLAGGRSDVISKARPVIESFSSGMQIVSEDPALASNAKLMANYTIVASLELMGEVYAWAAKVGIDRDFVKTLLDAVLAGPALRAYNQKVAERSFAPGGFALEGGLKDVELMLGAAGEVHVPLPFASVLRDRLLVAMARDMGDLDWSALTEIARDIAPVD